MNEHLTPDKISNHYNLIKKSHAFRSVASINTREEYDRVVYTNARPKEYISSDINEIIASCGKAYYAHGILRSIIELMSEFIVDGLQILHEDPSIASFYDTWMKKVKLEDRSEKFANLLYRCGNVVVQRYSSKITVAQRNKMIDGKVVADKIGLNSVPKYKKAEIPTDYFFYDPATIYLVGDDIGAYSQEKIYGLRVPTEVAVRFSQQRTKLEKQSYQDIPKEIIESAKKNNSTYIVYPLKQENIYVAHYKKDDWQTWAYPLIYSVLQDLFVNEKLKLAKAAAFDNFRSFVRVWKLGDHKEGILPPDGAAETLNEILLANDGGGSQEFIWDSMIDFQESVFPVEKLESFDEDNTAVLILFGVPDEIIGGTQKSSQSSNSSARLKNLAKKLQAGRREVKHWIEYEVGIVHRNMGFSGKPIIRFKNDDLMDEKIYYTLLRELMDRNVLSDQTMLERLEEIPEIERVRVKRENEARDKDGFPAKAGPFHNPDLQETAEIEMKKINLQNAVNVKNDDKKNGRPPGAKDKFKRKRGMNKPRSFAMVYGESLLTKIESEVTPLFLEQKGVKTLRELSGSDKTELDDIKYAILAGIEPGRDLTSIDILDSVDSEALADLNEEYNILLEEVGSDNLTIAQKRALKISAYSNIWVL